MGRAPWPCRMRRGSRTMRCEGAESDALQRETGGARVQAASNAPAQFDLQGRSHIRAMNNKPKNDEEQRAQDRAGERTHCGCCTAVSASWPLHALRALASVCPHDEIAVASRVPVWQHGVRWS